MPSATTTTNASDRSPAPGLAAWALPAIVVGSILVFVVPLPAAVLDVLLAANVTAAVLVLLTTLAVRTPLEFSAFPTILLTTTLTRLVLNVATARRVLVFGREQGTSAAGEVVRAFGEFVAGDQLLVGVILFAILVIIQFVVITKGATRISEVAARFTLDGLPGRQMAIDADLQAGLIDQHEAARRRDGVYRQADFFGAMDGAGKFVRGDAVAGVMITLVNILGGLFMGVVQQGMPPSEALGVYTTLTIGDGLVSQVPAFLISLAAGFIVTRSSTETDLGRDVAEQLFRRPEVMGAAAGFLVVLSMTGMPKLPLWTLAGALAVGSFVAASRRGRPDERIEPEDEPVGAPEPASDRMEDLLQVDPLELETGFRLIALSDPTRGGDLLEKLRGVRQRVARELGLIVPPLRIRDEIGLGPHEYRIKIRGTLVGQGTAYAGRLLAVPPAGMVARPDGRDGVDPATGQPAVWIHADGREVAELAGCRVLETSTVLAGHFGEIVLDHADELLTHEQVLRLLDRARATSAALVDEVVPGMLRAGEVQRVLQALVRERVSVRDLETILETLAEHAGRTRDTDALAELARQALGRQVVQQYRGPDGRLRVVGLSRALDARLASAAGAPEGRPSAYLDADAARTIARAVAASVGPLVEHGYPPVVLCSTGARPVLKDLTRADLPRLVVLGRREIPRDLPVETLGVVGEEEVRPADEPAAVPPRPHLGPIIRPGAPAPHATPATEA